MKKILLLTKTLLAAVLLCVGQNSWGDEINATLDHTASSSRNGSNVITTTVDAEYEHYNNTKQAAWGGWAYAQFSFTIPAGHSIESATLTWATTIGGRVGTNRDNDIYYVNAGTTIDYASLTSTTNLNPDATYITKVVKAGATTAYTGIETDVTSAVRTIAATQGYIIFKWTNNAAGADLHGKASTNAPTLVITTTSETLYDATFNANEGAINPSITVYSNAERTSPIDKDALSANTTYYYTATLAGYNDYEGSFAVESSNPTVNFTMTAKTRYTFAVNAVDAESNVIKTIYTDADSYEGKTHTIVYPKYLTGTGNIVTYSKDNDTYGESKTASASNETYEVSYTAYDGVAYFVEVEDVVSATAYDSWNCSNGRAVRGFTTAKDVFTVPATGVYDITYAACNNNVNSTLSVTLSKNDTEIATKSDLQYVSVNYIKSTGIVSNSNVSLASGDVLRLTPSSTNGIIDYILIELKSVPVTPANDKSTYVTTQALDFSEIAGLKAYVATAAANGSVTLSEVGAVPAGTPLILVGTAGTEYTVPVVASASAPAVNMLLAGDGTTEFDGTTYDYILFSDGLFYKIGSGTVATNKAYLHCASDPTVGNQARGLRLSFGGNITGVDNVEAAAEAKAQDGKFVENGKIVIVKNGVKYNAAGQQVK